MSLELGLEYKRRAQAKIYEQCQGDMGKFSQLCAESMERLEREGGFKFKRGVPAGWIPPEIEWPDSTETEMVIHETTQSKYAAPAQQLAQISGAPVSYAQLPEKTHKTTVKRRNARSTAAGPK